jgi:hypothetical protein
MRWFLIFILLFTSVKVFAQEKTIEGLVIDKVTRDRIATVNILNVRTKKSIYNNLKGEFSIRALPGDQLIFQKQDYYGDTLVVKNDSTIAVYMRPIGIKLKEVNIKDKALTPEKQLEAIKRDYSKIYGSSANPDFLTTSPGSGAGIGIDALYSALSRSGRNADRLRDFINEDYKQNVISYRFNKTFVSNITGLKDQQLIDFMFRYRPSYYLVTTASDYEFIVYVRNNYKRYLRNPKANRVAPLYPSNTTH